MRKFAFKTIKQDEAKEREHLADVISLSARNLRAGFSRGCPSNESKERKEDENDHRNS